jgi:hypothetical protein
MLAQMERLSKWALGLESASDEVKMYHIMAFRECSVSAWRYTLFQILHRCVQRLLLADP